MTELLDFCKENWMMLTAILFSLISFLVHLFQKRPVANSLNDWIQFIISRFMPNFIVQAEKSGLQGKEKKDLVLHNCLDLLVRHIKYDESGWNLACREFSDAIEKILETPRKKG